MARSQWSNLYNNGGGHRCIRKLNPHSPPPLKYEWLEFRFPPGGQWNKNSGEISSREILISGRDTETYTWLSMLLNGARGLFEFLSGICGGKDRRYIVYLILNNQHAPKWKVSVYFLRCNWKSKESEGSREARIPGIRTKSRTVSESIFQLSRQVWTTKSYGGNSWVKLVLTTVISWVMPITRVTGPLHVNSITFCTARKGVAMKLKCNVVLVELRGV